MIESIGEELIFKYSQISDGGMNDDRKDFLNVVRMPPARFDVQETAWYLGFSPNDIPILLKAGLLKPLGHPPHNGIKYFGAATLADLREDVQWLARASDAIVRHWQKKNAGKAARSGEASSGNSEPRIGTDSQPGLFLNRH